jgi:tetratricopeptide (TPR) repeat protein
METRVPLAQLMTGMAVALMVLGPAVPVAAQSGDETPPPSSGESSSEFSTLVKKGTKAFQAEDYPAAVDAFEKAYEVKPVPNLLYNIGRAHEKSGDFQKAVDFYEKFVNEPDVELKARRDALDRMKTLREVLALRQEGEEVDKKEVEDEQSDRGLVSSEKVDPDEAASESADPEMTVKRNYTPAFIFMGAGLAALAGGGVFTVLTSNAHSDFESATTLQARRQAADRGASYALAADGLWIGGAALSATSLILFLAPSKREVPVDRAARVVPRVGPRGAGMTFSVDF